jgi:hypothetical protein
MSKEHSALGVYVLENLRHPSVVVLSGDFTDAWLNRPDRDVKLLRKFAGGEEEARILAQTLEPYLIDSMTFKKECAPIFSWFPAVEDFREWIGLMPSVDFLPSRFGTRKRPRTL